MAVKEMIYLTVKHVLADGSNDKTRELFETYKKCVKTKITVHKAVYAVFRILQKRSEHVDFGYYWGECGPYSDLVLAKITQWITPGLANDTNLKQKMPPNTSDDAVPLRDYYENLTLSDDGSRIYNNVRDFFALDISQNEEDANKYYELLASALYIYAVDDSFEELYKKLRAAKSESVFDDEMITNSSRMFIDRKGLILDNEYIKVSSIRRYD